MLAFRELKNTGPDPETVAIDALGYIAADPELMNRFLDLTGLKVDELRAAASGSAFLVGVLDFILGDEVTTVRFAETNMMRPDDVGRAREKLAGPEAY